MQDKLDGFGDDEDEGDDYDSPAKRQREDVADRWVDGLFRYRFRGRLWLLSDPRGKLVRGTGTGMWSAGEVLVDYMAAHPELYRDAACLEVGAGLGAVGLTLAACGARHVVLTDVAQQLPLLRRNVQENFPESEAVQVRVLDWWREEHRMSLAPWNRSWSVVVGSDIGYDPELLKPLVATLVAQCSEMTSVYLALADREEDDEPNVADFIEAARDNFDCRVVFTRQLEPFQSITKVLLLRLRPSTSMLQV